MEKSKWLEALAALGFFLLIFWAVTLVFPPGKDTTPPSTEAPPTSSSYPFEGLAAPDGLNVAITNPSSTSTLPAPVPQAPAPQTPAPADTSTISAPAPQTPAPADTSAISAPAPQAKATIDTSHGSFLQKKITRSQSLIIDLSAKRGTLLLEKAKLEKELGIFDAKVGTLPDSSK